MTVIQDVRQAMRRNMGVCENAVLKPLSLAPRRSPDELTAFEFQEPSSKKSAIAERGAVALRRFSVRKVGPKNGRQLGQGGFVGIVVVAEVVSCTARGGGPSPPSSMIFASPAKPK